MKREVQLDEIELADMVATTADGRLRVEFMGKVTLAMFSTEDDIEDVESPIWLSRTPVMEVRLTAFKNEDTGVVFSVSEIEQPTKKPEEDE